MAAFDQRLASSLRNKWKLRLWMLRRLPMGLASGMYISELDEDHCTVVLQDRWWIRNPFNSVFWAVMSMAAELSTGALVFAYGRPGNMQFILVGFEAKFLKKAKGKSFYFCRAGKEVERAISNNMNNPAPSSIIMPVLAQDESGQVLAEFICYWQLRKPIT